MAPLAYRQLGIASLISQAFESRMSTASTAFFGTTLPVVVDPTPTLSQPTTPVVVQPTAIQTTTSLDTLTQSAAPATSTQAPVPTDTPTVSVIIFTTTTTSSSSSSDSLISATPAVTSSIDILTSTTPISSLVLTTPAPDVANVPATSTSLSSPSTSASGVATGVGTGVQTQSNKGMSGGIIALIVVGALLAALLAGAFTFRRVQVYRRNKRRENNYGAGHIPDNAPFPFTNVSETDLKGAEPIRDLRQGSATSLNEKPLPSIAPAMPTYVGNFNKPVFGTGMSGPYPVMGGAAYGYSQPGRTASPAPSQAPRVMSPIVPPAAVIRTGSPALSGPVAPSQYPQSLTPAPPPAPTPAPANIDALSPHMHGRKRVLQTFQPSLPDELDIREGDWVTIVHAYDDGWGLCERNGRRGVVPLECLDIGKPDLRASRRLSSLSAIRQ